MEVNLRDKARRMETLALKVAQCLNVEVSLRNIKIRYILLG